MLNSKVEDFIRKNGLLLRGDSVAVAFSGGPDSTALLHILCALRDKLGISVSAVHINHGLRGNESNEDESFAIELAKQLSVPIHVKKINVENFRKGWGGSIQSASREIRYKIFSHLIKSGTVNKIATGHTADDSVETVLMNILRGAGVHGLSGIQSIRDGCIIRPFMDIWKDEILEFLEAKGIHFRVDSSNASMKYTRNSVRDELIPFLQKYNSEVKKSIKRSSIVMSDIKNYMSKVGKDAFDSLSVEAVYGNSVILDCELMKNLDRAVQMEVIRHSVEQAVAGQAEISFDNFEEVLKLVAGSTNGETHIHGLKVFKSSNRLCLKNRAIARVSRYCYDFTLKGDIYINETGSVVHVEPVSNSEMVFDQSCKKVFVDADALPNDAVIRNRREGDSFQPMGLAGMQKLKKFFINNKVPRWEREKLPLLVSGRRVLWIPGYRLSEELRIKNDTRSVLCLAYKD